MLYLVNPVLTPLTDGSVTSAILGGLVQYATRRLKVRPLSLRLNYFCIAHVFLSNTT